MAGQLTRYENRAKNMHDLDPDGDDILEVGTSSDRPVYGINTKKRSAILTWYKAGFKLAWYYPVSFGCVFLFFWFVLRPMVLTAPVALFRSNPKILTEREAGGELAAWTNNTLVNLRGVTGTALEATQEAQIKQNTANSDRRPAENLVPKAKVVFVEN